MAKGNEVALKATDNVVALQASTGFESFVGLGVEELTTQDMAIPFLRILAQLSPQVNKRDGAYVKDAEPGMIYNTVANEVYSGEQGITVIPCRYSMRQVEWKPREKGGGYVNSYHGEDPITKTTRKDDRGQDVLPNGNLLTRTAQWFVLLLHPENGPQRCLITMSSTQLKKSRNWVTMTQSVMGRNKNGSFVMPIMSQFYTLRTTEERNDKGSWFGWDIARIGQLDIGTEENGWQGKDSELLQMGVTFSKAVASGDVKVKEDNMDSHESDDAAPF